MLDAYYLEKSTSYYKNARTDLMKLVPKQKEQRILEVGASGGYTLLALKTSGYAAYCAGVELFELPASEQKNPLIDDFVIADVELFEPHYEEAFFDVIIFGDVLEHLRDPWTVLAKYMPFVKKGGTVIVSVPNIQFVKVAWNILFKGTFQYESSGIMDKTHLRFFCKKNLIEMMQGAGIAEVKAYPSYKLQAQSTLSLANNITLGLLEGWWAIQYIAAGTKA